MPEKRTGKRIVFKGKTKVCEFYKGKPWDKPLTNNMKKFERETGQKAVFRGVVTGSYEYWKYWKNEFPVKKRRTKIEVKQTKKKEKKTKYEPYVKYSITELRTITIKNKKRLPLIAYNQCMRYVEKYKKVKSPAFKQVYKLKIIEIFEIYNIPYNKNMVVKRKVLVEA